MKLTKLINDLLSIINDDHSNFQYIKKDFNYLYSQKL